MYSIPWPMALTCSGASGADVDQAHRLDIMSTKFPLYLLKKSLVLMLLLNITHVHRKPTPSF